MTSELFTLLLSLIDNHLRKPRQRIQPKERLALTLLYLAHGTPLQCVAWSFKIGKSTARKIILETCEVLWTVLSPFYVSEPTASQYKDIAEEFEKMWDMHHCVGAIDGKHIRIQCPKKSGSSFFNYKKYYSIVLMATCDAKYTFTSVSIGSFGSESDGGIFRNTPFGRNLLSNSLPLPPAAPLTTKSDECCEYFFVGDAAFPLRENLMRPFPSISLDRSRTIFNYRLSRARRTIENAFGILSARWRVLLNCINAEPTNCEKIVLACIALHNLIMLNDAERWYCPDKYADYSNSDGILNDGSWRSDVLGNGKPTASIRTFQRRGAQNAINMRNTLANYFVNEGAVSFQDKCLYKN